MTPVECCPECGSRDVTRPDGDGWQFCNFCDAEIRPDPDEKSENQGSS